MTTFSRIVDELALQEFNRPHQRTLIASYLNQTIRDVHFKKNGRAAVLFGENRREVDFIIPALPAVWPIPATPDFQSIEAIYLQEACHYLVQRSPSRAFEESHSPSDRYYWYRTGSAIAMNGPDIGNTMAISYFEFPKQLQYYPDNLGPATWDTETQTFIKWDSINKVNIPATVADIALVSHWLIQRHAEALKEGVRAKLYRRLDNEVQARMSWSEFEDVRESIHFAEAA